ncbi:acetylglutamate semialdehyde dehydrogenase [Bacillus cereus group sp. MG11]|uniref:acetylglutamate semialdehyde dehydrogenase n=1 Tax=Bacillus cereus group sp. MG11 TaxID=3040248 RepID=UPI003395496B
MERGLTLKEFFKQQEFTEKQRYDVLTTLDGQEKLEYSKLLEELEVAQGNPTYTTRQKGDALESLVNFLIEKSVVFQLHQNIRTSSNEIDQLLVLNSTGRKFKQQGLLNLNEDVILAECKNYQDKVDVTWVGKFFSLMTYTSTKIGLLFSYHGLTGESWRDAVGLTKKLYLSKENAAERIHILEFSMKDFKLIAEGHTLLGLIEDKTLALRTDTNYIKLISAHPAEGKLEPLKK